MTRALLKDSKLPKSYWSDAVVCAAYLRNRLPSVPLQFKTPIEVFSKRKPNLSFIRRFGQHCYAKAPDGKKLDDSGDRCVLLGFGPLGYKLLDLRGRCTIYRRHCMFIDQGSNTIDGDYVDSLPESVDDGNLFDGSSNPPAAPTPRESTTGHVDPSPVDESPLVDDTTFDNVQYDEPFIPSANDETNDATDDAAHEPSTTTDFTGDQQQEQPNLEEPFDDHADDDFEGVPPFEEVDPSPSGGLDGVANDESRRGYKRSRSDDDLEDSTDDATSALRRSNRRIVRPRRFEDFALSVVDLCLSLQDTPRTIEQALSGPEANQWRQAIDSELHSLKLHGTWEDTTDSPTRSLDTTWVFRRKLDQNGRVVKYKARLVIKGYMQVEGIDFDQTHAPVARITAIRAVLALSASKDLEIFQYDVDTAFLNADIDVDIYIRRPQGCSSGTPILKLKKSLYGLRQSPRCWNSLLDSTLKQFGFKPTASDPCIYVYGHMEAYIIVYVDDLILCAKTKPFVKKFESFLASKFSIKQLGELGFCLGVAIQRDRKKKTISVSQRSFISQLLDKFDIHQHGLLEPKKNRPATGQINSSLSTTYHISYAISTLSRSLASPTAATMTAAKDVLRYLKHSILGGPAGDLVGYCDADWASDATDRKSQSGFVFLLGDRPISWRSVKQNLVATSSVEAEYISLSSAVSEALYLKQLLVELGVASKTVVIHEDNMGVLHLAKNPGHHDRTKHFDVRLHRVRDYVSSKQIGLVHVRSQDQLADGLTKPLKGVMFAKFKKALLVGAC
ncbi:hypothetical protein AeRB84_002517 [Aphanomyces euteiches]|nr:hypothetical protein AeRB84_002517 [Aphanomyces euteiches]